jgi:regulator of cell morphogenesis and NO signaling
MFVTSFKLDPALTVSEIVTRDYRTAEVFRRYGIGYCCGGKWPLEIACEMQGVKPEQLLADLEKATRTVQVSSQLDFENWSIDFLIDYIVHVHHHYLEKNLVLVKTLVSDFVREHARKYPWFEDLEQKNSLLSAQLVVSMKKEEEVLFPYIRQVAHAYKDKEPYAELLVRTLRKPVDDAIASDYKKIRELLLAIRNLSDMYTVPPGVCTSHKVVLSKLREQDNDISQHLFLEQSALYPRALAIEAELLSKR